ncbi:hypothetical protein KI387_020587, partial [Taxus chinensis]
GATFCTRFRKGQKGVHFALAPANQLQIRIFVYVHHGFMIFSIPQLGNAQEAKGKIGLGTQQIGLTMLP